MESCYWNKSFFVSLTPKELQWGASAKWATHKYLVNEITGHAGQRYNLQQVPVSFSVIIFNRQTICLLSKETKIICRRLSRSRRQDGENKLLKSSGWSGRRQDLTVVATIRIQNGLLMDGFSILVVRTRLVGKGLFKWELQMECGSSVTVSAVCIDKLFHLSQLLQGYF